MELSIFSRKQPIFLGKVRKVRLPGSVAPFQVFQDHVAMVTSLTKGMLTYESTKGESYVALIEGGVAKIRDNKIIVLAEACSTPSKSK